jgi:hypothetical protein
MAFRNAVILEIQAFWKSYNLLIYLCNVEVKASHKVCISYTSLRGLSNVPPLIDQ